MVSVPIYQRTETDRPIHQQGLTVRASGDDFGAGIGRGLQQVAAGIDQASASFQRVQTLEDATRAKEADNALAEWSRNAMYGDGGFMTLEGKAAVDARAEFEKSWEEQRKTIGAGLSAGASRAYNSASTARRNSVFDASILHTAQQRKDWIKGASAARVETFAQDALAGFNDPKKVDFNVAAGQAELRQQAELEGWDADTLAKREMDFISGVRQAIVMRMAVDDPSAAKTYADRFADQLTGTAQAQIAATLDASVKDELSKTEAARIMGLDPLADNSPTGRDEAAAAPPAGSIEEQLAAIKDDDVRELTRKRINAAQTLSNSAREAAAKEAKGTAFDFIVQGGSPDDLPFELKSAIGVEGMSSLWTYYEKQASGEHTISDDNLVYGLNKRAAFDPAGFSKLDLNDYRSDLSPTDFKSLMELQTKAIKDVGALGAELAPMKQAYDQADVALAGIGLSNAGLSGADREKVSKRISVFQNTLAAQITEFKDKNDRNPNEAEIGELVNRLLLPVVMKKPNWYGGTDDRGGFIFEVGGRADNERVDVAVRYQDIPIDLREAIASDLELELGRKPGPEEVTARYEEFVLSR